MSVTPEIDHLHDCVEAECWNCGGEGFVSDCIDGFCEDAESGCDLCTRRCDICHYRKHGKVAK